MKTIEQSDTLSERHGRMTPFRVAGIGTAAGQRLRSSRQEKTTVKVLIFGLPSLFQEGLRAVLDRAPDFSVAGIVGSGDGGLRLIDSLAPDIIVVGPELADMSAADFIWQLRTADQGTTSRIAVFGSFSEPAAVIGLLQAGVYGFLDENIMSDMLLAKLRQFAQGQPVLDSSTISALLDWCAPGAPASQAHSGELDKLSSQERRVLGLMAEGLPTADIATRLRLGETTVRTHVHRMKLKLGLSSRYQLIAFAVRCAEHCGPAGR